MEAKRSVFKEVVDVISPTNFINNHLNNKEKSIMHRGFAGVLVICTGVLITKIPFASHSALFVTEAVGYGVHAIGCIPFVDYLTNKEAHVIKSTNRQEGFLNKIAGVFRVKRNRIRAAKAPISKHRKSKQHA